MSSDECVVPNATAYNSTACPSGVAFLCSCDAAVLCCDTICRECHRGDDPAALLRFSWPLVAAWYAMLIVLFCFGRRGRLSDRFCGFRCRGAENQARRSEAQRDRARNDDDDDEDPDGAGRDDDFGTTRRRGPGGFAFEPVVKTRALTAADLRGGGGGGKPRRPTAGDATAGTTATEDDVDDDDESQIPDDEDVASSAPVCTICLTAFKEGDVVANLECPHLYHHECIVPWLRRKATCPLCAMRIDVEGARSSPRTPLVPPARFSERDADLPRTATSDGDVGDRELVPLSSDARRSAADDPEDPPEHGRPTAAEGDDQAPAAASPGGSTPP
mmetsp:Transcript_11799/g.47604  ORF Transcript_11799/g.47604 Transcript_11799/m.47604 type:complete len:331 (-) Transcript_11799:229-1221(-)|eukprot:CAMPEP_0185701314 /NCGR_PEP_ID=MMETSP1164-20130828/9048_1 /TAXON_ID=1104430 /ORGANISM="Chrysoreinhardia sp, Strain CCMP2950" /LENGTH=330 /DNA_ID=CAMNT_0028368345 /DNA_START=188 /DNA_END=1180 /DNA_ORIENTATION=+